MQRTHKDRVAQLDLLDDDRAHVALELHAPGLGVGGAGGSALQVLELALRQVNRQVSEPLLELRAPLVRPLELLQVVEPAPRLVSLKLLLKLRVQLVLLDRGVNPPSREASRGARREASRELREASREPRRNRETSREPSRDREASRESSREASRESSRESSKEASGESSRESGREASRESSSRGRESSMESS